MYHSNQYYFAFIEATFPPCFFFSFVLSRRCCSEPLAEFRLPSRRNYTTNEYSLMDEFVSRQTAPLMALQCGKLYWPLKYGVPENGFSRTAPIPVRNPPHSSFCNYLCPADYTNSCDAPSLGDQHQYLTGFSLTMTQGRSHFECNQYSLTNDRQLTNSGRNYSAKYRGRGVTAIYYIFMMRTRLKL